MMINLNSPQLTPADKISFIALLISALAFGVGYCSYDLSREVKRFNENTFAAVYLRDSLLGLKQDTLVEKQLKYTNEQIKLQRQQFIYDSLFSKQQLDLFQREYSLKLESEKLRKKTANTELLSISNSIKNKRKYFNLNPNDTSDLKKIEIMIVQILTELHIGRSNELYVVNNGVKSAWEEIIQNANLLELIMVNKGRRGANILDSEKLFKAAFEATYSNLLKSIDKAEEEIRIHGVNEGKKGTQKR